MHKDSFFVIACQRYTALTDRQSTPTYLLSLNDIRLYITESVRSKAPRDLQVNDAIPHLRSKTIRSSADVRAYFKRKQTQTMPIVALSHF